MERLAGGGDRQAARGTVDEPRAQPLFQAAQALRYHRRREMQAPAGGRQAAAIDDRGEQGIVLIHSFLVGKNTFRDQRLVAHHARA